MAKKEKVSFLFYYEYVEQFKLLEKDEIIAMLEDIVNFEKNGVTPVYEDRTLKSIWAMIFNNLSEDNQKYIERCNTAKANGSLGGRPPKNQNKPIGFEHNQSEPRKPDIDTHIDKDIYMCVDEQENEKNDSNFCHLNRTSKIEACKDCLKNAKCPLQTDSTFILEKGSSFEEWLAKRQVLSKRYVEQYKESSDLSEEESELLESYDYLNDHDE